MENSKSCSPSEFMQSGLSVYGRIDAVFTFIFVALVGAFGMIYGFDEILTPNTKIEPTVGTIQDAVCSSVGFEQYKCFLKVGYMANGEHHESEIEVVCKQPYSKGMKIKLYYDPVHPCRISKRKDSDKLAWMIILCAIVSILISWKYVSLTFRYTQFAVIAGLVALTIRLFIM